LPLAVGGGGGERAAARGRREVDIPDPAPGAAWLSGNASAGIDNSGETNATNCALLRFGSVEAGLDKDRIVAVGFLTASDLDHLGNGFRRHFPVEHDDIFDDLLRKLDDVEASPLGRGVTIQHKLR